MQSLQNYTLPTVIKSLDVRDNRNTPSEVKVYPALYADHDDVAETDITLDDSWYPYEIQPVYQFYQIRTS